MFFRGRMEGVICAETGCSKPRQEYRTNKGKQAFRPYCSEHWSSMLRGGKLAKPTEIKRTTRKDGYVLLTTPGGSSIMEHRVIMEAVLGRMLQKNESVHHKNGIRHDNRPENLELWVGAPWSGVRASDFKCPHCGKSYA